MRRSAWWVVGLLTLLVACDKDDPVADQTPPLITVTGVSDGQFSNAEHLVLGFSATDANAVTVGASLDGQAFVSGASVSDEGAHTLIVEARDEAGNTAKTTVRFTLDRTVPVVSISGVAEGQRQSVPATLTFSATDDHLDTVEGVLDGVSFSSGGTVTAEGAHALVVTAQDRAGNSTKEARNFVIDLAAPSVAFVSPAEAHATSAASVHVIASTTGVGQVASVHVGTVRLVRGEDGLYRGTVPLEEGENRLTLLATYSDGSTQTASRVVFRDSTKPLLTVSAPTEGQSFSTLAITVEGSVQDASAVSVTVNGHPVEVAAGGSFSHAVTLAEGPNTLTVNATDVAGNLQTVIRTVQASLPPPALAVSEPTSGFTTSESSVLVQGTATSAISGEPLTVSVGGAVVTRDAQGHFQRTVSLALGSNTIEVSVVDPRGRRTELSLQGTRTASTDGGTVDPDGGTTDGGTPDGGTVDPDGGTTDGGTPDGGQGGTDGGGSDPSQLALSVDSPIDGLMTSGETVAVSGRIGGGTAPFSVTIGAVAAAVSGHSFGLALPLSEGAHTLTIQVVDAEGRTGSTQRRVTVDRTKPFLSITRPDEGTTEVSESPYRVEGAVGDLHLAGVTVQGAPANIIAGQYRAYVPLPSGTSQISVVATDLAGNREVQTRTVTVNGVPPVVTILEPLSGSEAQTAVVRVRARVSSHVPLESVLIGTGTAEETSPGEYVAEVPLSLGDNTLTVTATDVLGLRGSAMVQVRFRDAATEALVVTGVSPSPGEANVTPDRLISVAFNKAVAPASLAGRFEVLSEGGALEGGYSLAPGGQTATFIAKAPLPEGSRLTVRVRDLQAVTGPAQSETFVSEFLVRRPLTRVRGVVTDDELRPLPGVLVTLEGQGATTRSGPDGNWAFVGIPGGDTVLRYEGGQASDGRPMPTVRRRLFLAPEAETVDARLTMTPVDAASAQQVEAGSAVHLTFNERHGALGVDLPANGLTLENGQTRGAVAATRLETHSVPVPQHGGFGLTGVWQLSPAGSRLTAAAELQFPNLTGLPAGRRALLFAYEPQAHVIQHVAFGVVTPDGAAIRSESPVEASSLEYLGYLGLNEAQHQAVEAALAGGGGTDSGPDGGIQGLLIPPSRPLWKRILNEVLSEAHAQGLFMGGFGAAMGAFQDATANAIPAAVVGKVRAPREQRLAIEVKQPPAEALIGQYEVPGNTFPLELGFAVHQELGQGMPEGGADPLSFELSVINPDGTPQGPQSGVSWSAEGDGHASLQPTVVVREGLTQLLVSAKLGTAISRSMRLEAKLEQLPEGAGILPPFPGTPEPPPPTPGARRYQLSLRRAFDSADDGDKAFQSLVRFEGLRVTVTGPGSGWSGVTGETGGYGIPVPTPTGTQHGISCAELPLGTRPVAIADAASGTGVRTELISADFPACSPAYWVSPGSTIKADILFDVRLLKGALTFVDRQGVALPMTCDGTGSVRDPATGELSLLDSQDVTATEVHFFREDNLELPIARYTVGAPLVDACGAPPGSTPSHGRYARVRPGPNNPSKRALKQRCAEILADHGRSVPPLSSSSPEDVRYYWSQCVENRLDFLRLGPGDRIVAVAVNHATGHTGMARVVVPPISTIARDADGKCPADEAAGGLLEIDEHGEKMQLSRCAEAEVSIQGDIQLFPPEVDVRITRRAPEEGLRRDALPMSVRQGGAATNRDDYVQVSTHWRVRTSRQQPGAPGAPAGSEDCESSPDGGSCPPGMLVDRGDAGHRLEVFCSELLPNASEAQRASCLPNDLELTDVPAGVPPLAGQLVRVTGAAVEQPAVVVFQVKPGRGSAAVHAGMKLNVQGAVQTLNNLTRATYYLHVVGQQVFPRDANGDDRINEEELLAKPPNFTWVPDKDPLGQPTQAVQLKNVYRSLEPDGTRVERYDLSREHEFRVIDVVAASTTAKTDTGERRLDDDKEPAAQESDLSYQFFTSLMEVSAEDQGRADVMPGEYVVRLGSDAYGMECPLKVVADGDKRLLTADCEGEYFPEILASSDLLYIELYLSGNADNILYRFNFYGLAPRYDYLPAGSAYTAERSVEVYQGRPVLDRTVSQPAILTFAVEPAELQEGTLRICVDPDCTEEVLKEANLKLLSDGSFDVTVVHPSQGSQHRGGTLQQLPEPALYGARRFRMPVPAELAEMPGPVNPRAKPIYLVLESLRPRLDKRVRVLGKPKGHFVSANAWAAGQASLGGINLADGHLSFMHEDFAVPHYAETVRFVRTYNNQNNTLSPVGLGWNHNFEGVVLEESLGRYTVLLNGQSHDFPSCAETDADAKTAWNCKSDNAHGFTLEVRSKDDAPDVTVKSADGWTFKFDRKAVGSEEEGRRKWLLTRFEDGHGREENGQPLGWTQLAYEADSNRVSAAERLPGKLKVVFDYEAISEASDVSLRLRQLARSENFKRLAAVTLLLKDGQGGATELHRVDLSHDPRTLNLEQSSRATDLTEAPPETAGIDPGPPAEKTTQRWSYAYAAVPDDVTGSDAWALSNEVEAADLRVNGARQWTASYAREERRQRYQHVPPREVVTAVRGTGHPDVPLKVTHAGATRRRIDRPDGVTVEVELNGYGNVHTSRLGSGGSQSRLAWESDNRVGAPGSARDGRVFQTSSTTPVGLTINQTPDDRLRTDSSLLSAIPSGVHPIGGLNSGGVLSRVQGRDGKGRAVQSSIASGTGLATVTTPRNPQGDVTRLQIENATGGTALLVSTELDVDGVLRSGTDGAGNLVTYGGFETQPLHLSTTTTVVRPASATGALASYVEHLTYDAYGRTIRSENAATGRIEEWNYDGLGRLRWRRLNSAPVQVWTYQYAHAADEVTVTERLNGTAVRETVTTAGLLRAERHWFSGGESTTQYQYQGGRLASWRDSRGALWRNVYDETTGWLQQTELLEGPGVTEPRVARRFGAFDLEGKPGQLTDQDGLVTRVEYDALGRAVKWTRGEDVEQVVLDANGAELRRTFGVGGRHILQTEVDALGRVIGRWNGAVASRPGNAGGDVIILEGLQYDGAGRVTERLDRVSGLKESYAYDDALGRLTRHVREVQSGTTTLELVETRTYVDRGARTVVEISRTIETPSGQRTEQRTLTLDVSGRVLETREEVPDAGEAVHLLAYDAGGRLLSHKPPLDGATTHSYDAQGWLLTKHEPGNVVTRFTYDATGAVLTQEGPHEQERWSLAYDAFGRLTERTLAATPKVEAATWRYAYLADAEVVETDPRGFVTRRQLNARGQVETETREGENDSLITRFTYDGPWLATSNTEHTSHSHQGATWRASLRREEYDVLGRPETEVESWEDEGLSYEYTTTASWNGTRSASITQSWKAGALGTTTRSSELELDSLGNTLRQAQGGLSDVWRYDAAGQLSSAQPAGVRTPRAYSYSQGYLTTETFGPETTGYTYDVGGRLKAATEPSGRVRALEYNSRGLVEKETYGRGTELVTARYTYDGGGNPQTVTHGVQAPITWTYEYGPLGELTAVTQPGGLGVFNYAYFPDRKLKGVTPPTGSGTAAQEFAYDFLGRETLRVRGSSKWATEWAGGVGTTINSGAAGVGDTLTQLFDGRGRLAKATYAPGPNSTVLGDAVASDLRGGTYQYNGVDQLVSALEERGSGDMANAFAYDERNRPTRVQRGTHLVEYAYGDTGDRTVRVTSRSGSATYAFDVLDRLSQVQSSQGPSAAVQWEPGGGRVETVAGADVFERYCHDGVGRIASVAAAATDPGCGSGGAGSVFTRFAYSYDEHGNRTEERAASAQGGADELTSYGYDVGGRLTGVRYPGGMGVLYRLAPDGTRLGEKVVSNHGGGLDQEAFQTATADLKHLEYTPEVGTGGLSIRDLLALGQPSTILTTDSAGQVIRKAEPAGVTGFHWDPAGRLTKVSRGASVALARYVYDYDGLRRASTTEHGVAEYVWSGEELVEEGLANGTGLLHLAGPAGVVGVGSERVLHDALGSAVARRGEAGGVRSFRFDAWGNYREFEAPHYDESALGYTGHTYDAEVGLTYAQQRWLDASTGRFLSEDPVGAHGHIANPRGLNQWMYAYGNPTQYIDPDGRLGFGVSSGLLHLDSLVSRKRAVVSKCLEDISRCIRIDREGGDRESRPINPSDYPAANHPVSPLQTYSEIRHAEIQEQLAADQSRKAQFYRAWYRSLRPPTATLPNGRVISVMENSHDLAARQQRQEVEFTIQTVDFLSRATLHVAGEYVVAEMGGAAVSYVGRGLVSKAVSGSVRAEAAVIERGVGMSPVNPPVSSGNAIRSDFVAESMPAIVSAEGGASTYLYRGVSANHPELAAARKGYVSPGNANGTVTSEAHNLGGVAAESPFTSWTRELDVARSHALKDGAGGVILRVPTGAPPPGASWSWELSPDVFYESEILLRGARHGVEVFAP